MVAKVEKVLPPNDSKAQSETIKYFTNDKAVVTNRPIINFPTKQMKQTSEDSMIKLVDDKKICQTETS